MEHRFARALLAWVSLFAASAAPVYAADPVDALDPQDPRAQKLRQELERRAAEDRKLIYQSLEKSEALGFVLSATVGFGAGHFYAGSTEMGFGFLAAELGFAIAGAPAILGGTSTASYASLTPVLAISAGLRLADAITAALQVADRNEELQRRYQLGNIKPRLSLIPDLQNKGVTAGLSLAF